MNLRWKQFEQALKPKLAEYDARRRMSRWQRIKHFLSASQAWPLWVFRMVLTAAFVSLALFHYEKIQAHPEVCLMGLGLWSLFVTVMRPSLLETAEGYASEYVLLWQLPLSPDRIFRIIMSRLVAGLGWLFAECFLIYAILAIPSPHPFTTWSGALACAALQAVLSLACSLYLIRAKIRSENLILIFAFLSGPACLAASLPHYAFITYLLFSLLNPLGWMNLLYLEGCVRWNPAAWWLLLPISAVIALSPWLIRSVRQMHRQGIFRIPRKPRRPGLDENVQAPVHDREQARQIILQGEYLDPLPWEKLGLVEKLIAGGLKPSERVLAGIFMLQAGPQWSKLYLRFIFWLLLCQVLNSLWKFGSFEQMVLAMLELRALMIFIPIVLLLSLAIFTIQVVHVLSMIGWTASIERGGKSDRNFPGNRLFPLGHWAPAKALIKINCWLLLLLLPLTIVSTINPFWSMAAGDTGFNPAVLPKLLFLLWGWSTLILSSDLTPSTFADLKYLRSSLPTAMTLTPALCLFIALLVARTPFQLCTIGILFVTSLLAAVYLAGKRYQKSFVVA